jgi:hypothetical protein
MIEDVYIPQSIFFAAWDAKEKVIGVVRQIQWSSMLFPSINDFDIFPEWRDVIITLRDKVVEIGSLAVQEGFRIAEGLYRQIWQYSTKIKGHTHWVAAIDSRLLCFHRYQRGFLWEDIGETKFYRGSLTTPVIAELEKQRQNMALINSNFLNYLDGPVPKTLFNNSKARQ